jgi:hypothetical protein
MMPPDGQPRIIAAIGPPDHVVVVLELDARPQLCERDGVNLLVVDVHGADHRQQPAL